MLLVLATVISVLFISGAAAEEANVDCYIRGRSGEYRGTMAYSFGGLLCQSWTATSPHNPSPKVKARTGPADGNHCRDPDNTGYPWCYTTGRVRWSACDVKRCSKNAIVEPQPSGGQKPQAQQPSSPTMQKPITTSRRATHIIHVGVDGFEPSCLSKTLAPNLMSLGERGMYTLDKAVTETLTTSAPCWTAVLSGMHSAQSGVDHNKWQPPGKISPLPTIFKIIKDQSSNSRTAAFYTWDWLRYLMKKNHQTSVDVDMETLRGDGSVADALSFYEAKDHIGSLLSSDAVSYTFVYMRQLDDAGHSYGFCTQKYLDAIRKVDDYIGELVELVEDKKGGEKTVMIVNSDHGGIRDKKRHNRRSINIPLFIQGSGVKVGETFPQQVENVDIAPTVAALLGLDASPLWSGRVLEEIFTN